MKQQILAQIETRLAQIGVSAKPDEKTDLAIDAELLDAKFSTGKKKIRYEAMILADEADKTVRMFEKTTELSAGVSFGMSAESTTQTGKTLFRKVKSVQYGPEGKVFEYEFDIGAIAKTVKETAKENGWKFKTVVFKKKAMY
ncbi:MAG TPA: hypothetical protein P5075_04835 [Eubacteriales bacterium]|nr:hypothetical protein [Eubacteriales bacterium]